jgi:hypothetical protein
MISKEIQSNFEDRRLLLRAFAMKVVNIPTPDYDTILHLQQNSLMMQKWRQLRAQQNNNVK